MAKAEKDYLLRNSENRAQNIVNRIVGIEQQLADARLWLDVYRRSSLLISVFTVEQGKGKFEMTIAKLRKELAIAERRVDKLFAKYKAFCSKLYVRTVHPAVSTPKYEPVLDVCFRNGELRGGLYVTDCWLDFYRRRKNGRFYMRLTDKVDDVGVWVKVGNSKGWHTLYNDCVALKKIEGAIESAIDKREALLEELEAADKAQRENPTPCKRALYLIDTMIDVETRGDLTDDWSYLDEI